MDGKVLQSTRVYLARAKKPNVLSFQNPIGSFSSKAQSMQRRLGLGNSEAKRSEALLFSLAISIDFGLVPDGAHPTVPIISTRLQRLELIGN